MDDSIKKMVQKARKTVLPPTACPDEEILSKYVTEVLPLDARDALEEHLADCGACRDVVAAAAVAADDHEQDARSSRVHASKKAIRTVKAFMKDQKPLPWWRTIGSWIFPLTPMPAMVTALVVGALVIVWIHMARAPSGPPLTGVPQLAVLVVEPGPGTVLPMSKDTRYPRAREESVVYPGEKFKVQVELPEEAYVYVILVDDKGAYRSLFPEKGQEENVMLQGNRKYEFPTEKPFFSLDKTEEKQNLILFTSDTPIGNLEERIQGMRDFLPSKSKKRSSPSGTEVLKNLPPQE